MFLNWFISILMGRANGVYAGGGGNTLRIFWLILFLCAGTIVSVGWYFVDRNESYRVGYPSPRTYLAQSSAKFVDNSATSDLRHQAAEQIVNVRVKDDKASQLVRQRLNDLKNSGNIDFASPQLVKIVNDFPEAERNKLLSAVVDIAEKNFDRALNRTEQSAFIWESLKHVKTGQAEKNVIYQILDSMLLPTVVEDSEMTARLRDDMSQKISPVVREVRLGGQLVQKGQIVTPGLAEILRSQGYPDAAVPWKHLCFILIFTFGWSIWLTWLAAKQEIKLSDREWTYIAVVLAVQWSTQRCFAAWNLDSFSLLAMTGWLYLTLPPAFAFHIVLGGGLVGYLIAFPGMTSIIAVGSLSCGVAAGGAYLFIREASSRIMIWRNIFGLGIFMTLCTAFTRWGFGLSLSLSFPVVYMILCAFWSSLVVAVLPLWESMFEIISPLRLLEMSHQSQPLLKRLQLEAPGTYHHTITVSTLAEAVADRLGMNALLVKTGAYYHDIGKLKRPRYFVENQAFGENIHDTLPARESAEIILAHVPDGLALADEYKLPPAIKNFIAEHHGRTLVGYFYKKAQSEDAAAGGSGIIDEDDFRYAGPNPQSRETALLMMADSIEAALKSIVKPLAGRDEVEEMVSSVIDSKIFSGQFVDVEFTLKDINKIKSTFTDILMSMYHTREVKPIGKVGGSQNNNRDKERLSKLLQGMSAEKSS